MRALKAGVIYFLLVFAVGWILGPIRELWAVHNFGRVAAMLSEAVIMLIAMMVAARWVIRRFEVPQTLSDTLSIGLVAIGLLLLAEIDRRGVGARAIAERVSGEPRDRPRHHLAADVSGVRSDADSRRATDVAAAHT
jgi:hypothetical protein